MKKGQSNGLISLIVMIVLSLALILGSDGIYSAIKSIGKSGSASMTAGTYTSTQQGFGGEVTVTMTCSDSAIEDVQIVGDAETPGLGGTAVEEMGGKIVDAQSLAVDGVSGATITSDAIIKAATDCLTQAGADVEAMGGSAAPAEEAEPAEETEPTEEAEEAAETEEAAEAEEPAEAAEAEETEEAAEPAEEGTYTSTQQGFGGDVTVTMVYKDGVIEDVQIVGDAETPELGGKAVEELAGKIKDAQSLAVDGVSGATITSDAIMKAATDCLTQAGADVEAMGGSAAPAEEAEPTEEAEEAAETEEAAEAEETEEAAEPAEEGTYTSTQKGFGGDITVTMVYKDGVIEDVQIVGDAETPGLGEVAVNELGVKMVEMQTPNVDAVSGATVSSDAIIKAATDCLTQAGADIAAMDEAAAANKTEVEKTEETLETDIVIVGAGGAGMSAAIKATQAGKDVIIIDKMPYVGGNTIKASGGMNAAGTKAQQAMAEASDDEEFKATMEDSTVENFIKDTMAGGHEKNDIELVTKMAEKSAEAVEWLESIGAPLPKVAATGGTEHCYIHSPEDGSAVGEYLVEKFTATMEELGIEVMLETEATEIMEEDGKVAGIKATSPETDYTINAKAVILATGGFGANFDMLASYDESLANAVTTNTPAATGDGIVMAEAIGADTVDMEYIQLHPTVYQETGLLVSEKLRSNGAILINKEGKRFVNDLATRDVVSQAELAQPDAYAFIVYDSKYTEEKLYQKYESITVTADTIEDLAKALGLEGDAVQNFVDTVDDWNKVCNGEKEDDFERNNALITLDQAPFTAIKIAPGVHHTMGGLKINTETEVLDTEGNAIPGLFAAGEVTGGVHGGNRIGGNAVADIVVFGQIAADSAVAYVE